VRFGPAGAKAVHSAIEDVNHDGDLDMILHFKTQETGIKPSDTNATLTGKTYDGISIEGTDTIRTVPPEWAAKYRKGEDEREEHRMGEGQKGEDQKGQQGKKDKDPPGHSKRNSRGAKKK